MVKAGRKPKLIVIAGTNGSGKTSVTQKFLHHEWADGTIYINPDQMANSFGTRTKITKDGQSIPNYPTLRIRIGAYHPLDRRCTEGIVPCMANQIWSYAQLRNVMAKSNGYGYTEEIGNTVQEPLLVYDLLSNDESDYIEP